MKTSSKGVLQRRITEKTLVCQGCYLLKRIQQGIVLRRIPVL